MYLLFTLHHWAPLRYYNASPVEKAMIRAFLEREAEDRKKAMDEINGRD